MTFPQIIVGLGGVLLALLFSQLVKTRNGWTIIACMAAVAGCVGIGYAIAVSNVTFVAKSAISDINIAVSTSDPIANMKATQEQITIARAKIESAENDWLFFTSVAMLLGGFAHLWGVLERALSQARVATIPEGSVVATAAPKEGARRRGKSQQKSKED